MASAAERTSYSWYWMPRRNADATVSFLLISAAVGWRCASACCGACTGTLDAAKQGSTAKAATTNRLDGIGSSYPLECTPQNASQMEISRKMDIIENKGIKNIFSTCGNLWKIPVKKSENSPLATF